MRRTLAGLLLAAMAALAGCGGAPNDIACAIVSCKPSGSIASGELAPSYVVQVGDGGTLASASFRTGGGAAADVQLLGDRLQLRIDNAAPLAFGSDTLGVFWTAEAFPTATGGSYRIELVRGSGATIASSVAPPAFAILSPVAPAPMTPASAPLAIVVDVAAQEQLVARLEGLCANQTHIAARVDLPRPTASGGGSTYLLPASALLAALGTQAGSGPTACDLRLLMGRESAGTVGSEFRADGHFTGRFERKIELRFDLP